jgi:peptidoglycan hydrolase-like protein with peptidoglycan-binding domain
MANAAPQPRADSTAGAAAGIDEGTGSFTASNGADVIHAVQRELRRRGYLSGPPSGVADLVTRAAVMAYQHDHGLSLTGEPSEELLKAIVFESSGAVRALASGTGTEQSPQAKQIIGTVQNWLSGLGYAVGKADGRLGQDTRRAIRKFEAEQGLPPTGRISGQLVAQLARVAGNGQFTAGP